MNFYRRRQKWRLHACERSRAAAAACAQFDQRARSIFGHERRLTRAQSARATVYWFLSRSLRRERAALSHR